MGRSYDFPATEGVLDPILTAMPDTDVEDAALTPGNVDDEVHAEGMNAHRRVDLGALAPDLWKLRQKQEGLLQPAMVGVRLSRPELLRPWR